ncbi:hypothetical protein AB4099_34960 [Bosea sp. 2KB_26]|uniref:hypothetical protein n=1 Tax=Bosea sp. 2KB_26 TaxID=3237475 RepID=UPI003F90E345
MNCDANTLNLNFGRPPDLPPSMTRLTWIEDWKTELRPTSWWPHSRQTVLDLAIYGRRRAFLASATTPLIAYADDALSVPLPASPDLIASNADGRSPRGYLPYRNHREEVCSTAGVLLWNGIANPAPASSGGGAERHALSPLE